MCWTRLEDARQWVLRMQPIQREPEHCQRVGARAGARGTQEIHLLLWKGTDLSVSFSIAVSTLAYRARTKFLLHWIAGKGKVVPFFASSLVPQCLASDCQPTSTSGSRRLRLSTTCTCPHHCGDGNFQEAALRLWNGLPFWLRHHNLSIGHSRNGLETHLSG